MKDRESLASLMRSVIKHAVEAEDLAFKERWQDFRTQLLKVKETADGALFILDNEPVAECSRCKRKTWGKSELGQLCNFHQPDGSICTGVFYQPDIQKIAPYNREQELLSRIGELEAEKKELIRKLGHHLTL